MSKSARVQVLVPDSLKAGFEERANEYGMDMSSAIRFIMHQFSIGAISPSITSSANPMVSTSKADKYAGIIDSIKSGREELIGGFDSAEELMKSLDS